MEPFRVSASQLSLYAICPRKYRYQYLEDRPRSEQPAALAFGSAVHAALAWAEWQRTVYGSVDLHEVLKIFCADMEAQAAGDPPLILKNGDTLEDLMSIGRRLLPLALQALDKTEPLAVEEPFEVALEDEELEDGTAIHLVGIFDRLEQDGSIVEIKTAKKRYSSTDVSQHLQATAYTLAQVLRTGKIPAVRLLVLLKALEPEAIWYETRRTKEELAWFSRLIGETVRAIDQGVYPPRISWACTDCEFRKLCSKEGMSSKRKSVRPQERAAFVSV